MASVLAGSCPQVATTGTQEGEQVRPECPECTRRDRLSQVNVLHEASPGLDCGLDTTELEGLPVHSITGDPGAMRVSGAPKKIGRLLVRFGPVCPSMCSDTKGDRVTLNVVSPAMLRPTMAMSCCAASAGMIIFVSSDT